MTSVSSQPLVDTTDRATAAFWAATQRSALVIQLCADCSYMRWPPGPVCTECQSRDWIWVEVRATGTLLSYCIYHRAFDRSLEHRIPYAVGYVELDDGPRMYGGMTTAFNSLAIGQPVAAVFENVTSDVTVVQWRMLDDLAGDACTSFRRS